MARPSKTVLAAVFAVLAIIYQFTIKPKLALYGQGRVIESIGNSKCQKYPEVKACGKLVLHEPNGFVYMACSTPKNRRDWFPPTNRINVTGKALSDYVAVFDPSNSKITKLNTKDFKYHRGLSVHGMDIVQSKERPSELLVYLVNHRDPLAPQKVELVGTDSVVEVFRTTPGQNEMKYLATFKDPMIATPHDVVGTGDDSGFYFTNDHGSVKFGNPRYLDLDFLMNKRWANVGYCHAQTGCKNAFGGLLGTSGITMDKEGKVYVSSTISGNVQVLERQSDDKLVVTDVIKLDRPVESLTIDKEGAIWAAGLPNARHLFSTHMDKPSTLSPSSAIRLSLNKGQSQFYGEKYVIDKVFEDDGQVASGTTTVVYDTKRKKLYLHGISAPHLTVCDVDI